MIDLSQAFDLIDRNIGPIGSEIVPLADAIGRVLAEDIVADTDLPPFDRSMMDGYAVLATDTETTGAKLKIVGESAAGRGFDGRVETGTAVRIMTGAPVPQGADAVQQLELAREHSDVVEVLEPAEKGRSIVRRGAEIRHGETLFRRGESIKENMIAALASFGYSRVRVGRSPRVAILATGSEIVDVSETPAGAQIRNSNSPLLDVLCRRHGASTSVLSIVKDEAAPLEEAIRSAAQNTDVLVITGGVSVGRYDHTEGVLASLGAALCFNRVRLKPGKPAVFGRLGQCVVFGLPGNPVSAAVTFHLFVRRALALMQGSPEAALRKGLAVLAAPAKAAAERDTFLPASLETDADGKLLAVPIRLQGSSDLVAFSGAEALISLKRGERKEADSVVPILFL
jgi:molybdopterin molybdotransferase